jgi:hypothetical protein
MAITDFRRVTLHFRYRIPNISEQGPGVTLLPEDTGSKFFRDVDLFTRIYRVFFNKLDALTALRFLATGAPPAAKRTRILPVTLHADNI